MYQPWGNFEAMVQLSSSCKEVNNGLLSCEVR